MTSKKIEWVDIAKGYGILLVIVGHCLDIDGKLFQFIYVFHMPLFFFLSGYVFNLENFEIVVRKKFRSLIIPFLIFYSLGLIITLLLPFWRSNLSFNGILSDLWLSDPQSVHNSSIWFLVCLFITTIAFDLLIKLSSETSTIVITTIYSLGIWYSRHRTEFKVIGFNRLPFNLDVVPAALIFYTLGFYARKTGIIEKALSSFENELMMFFTGIIGTIMVLAYNGYVNLHDLQFGNAIFYIAGGIIGTLIIVSASRLTIRTNTDLSKTVKSIVTFYGTNSLIILGIQSLLIRLYIEFCNRVFETQLSLYQFPLKHTVISTTIIGFIICPIVCIFWKFMKSMSFTVR